MVWSNYLISILERETALDDLALSLDGERYETMPSILKASILLTDKLLESGKRNMFVFPEQRTSAFIFMLLRTLHNIAEGRINRDYDPYAFTPGEKLKFRNSVVEFDCIETDETSGVERIWVKTRDTRMGIVLETAPFLQHVTTRLLSNDATFCREYHQFMGEIQQNRSRAFLQSLSDYKTHLDGASVFVAPILSTKNLLLNTYLNSEKISDTLLLAQSDVEGHVKNMTAGQLSGTPAIVLCQDLYTVCEAMNSGLAVNELYIEASQSIIDNQLDALDDLITKDKSIILMSDQMNLVDYSCLESRLFNIWTWNEQTITPELHEGSSRIDVRVQNARTKKVRYIDVSCPEICNALFSLNKNKLLIETQSAAIIQVFQDLLEISLTALRTVTPFSNSMRVIGILEKCSTTLEHEQAFLRTDLHEELCSVIENLILFYTSPYEPPKAAALTELLKSADYETIYVVIAQNTDKSEIALSIKNAEISDDINLIVSNPSEYAQSEVSNKSLTVIAGWLNRNTMNKLLNSNITPEIVTFLYEIEKSWKNGYTQYTMEQQKRSNAMNASILASIENELADDYEEKTKGPWATGDGNNEYSELEELDEIELTLRQNKYRSYISPTGEDSIAAIPVSFVGDLIAFYRMGHTLLTATKLINEDYDKIEEVKPVDIQTGDFVIERETQRDLIRDIADVILKNSNCLELRDTAYKWKEALEVESVFYDADIICEKILAVGCTRAKTTIHNWLTDDSMITPLSKDDIVYIAKAMDDEVLLEMVEQVFEAGKKIKSAHIQAGHHLAEKLRVNLAEGLSEVGNLDGFNVWQPIEVEIENIGTIKLLKVIDVGAEVLVDSTSTNRLIDTNRVAMLGG
jgi:hypothetical protein